MLNLQGCLVALSGLAQSPAFSHNHSTKHFTSVRAACRAGYTMKWPWHLQAEPVFEHGL